MIKLNGIWLFSIIAFVAIFLVLLIITSLNSTLRKKDFSPLRNFPYEFMKMNAGVASVYKPLLYVLTGFAFSPLFVITPLIYEFGDLGFLSIFITCVFGLASITNCLLFFFDARFNKSHVVLVTISMCLTLLANALASLLSFVVFKSYLDSNDMHVSSVIVGSLSALIALIMLLLIINPKLGKWTALQSRVNNEGERVVSRGKVFILALTEWLTILLMVLGEIIFFISLLK